MSNRNKEEIAGIVRNTLITKHGYNVDGNYVRKPISDNYGIGFYHDNENSLCLCIYHREGSQFSAKQKKVILDVLAREEFTASYHDAEEGEATDGKPEIWATLKIKAFDSWDDQATADWVVKLFEHFITTVELFQLT